MKRRWTRIGAAAGMSLAATLTALTVSVTSASAHPPQYNNSLATISCNSFFGTWKLVPGFQTGPPVSYDIVTPSDLLDCSDAGLPGVVIQGVVRGTLTVPAVPGNALSSFTGCTPVTGNLTINWKVAPGSPVTLATVAGGPYSRLQSGSTTLTPNYLFVAPYPETTPAVLTNLPTSETGDSLMIGDPACFPSAPSETGAWVGANGGAGTEAFVVTSPDAAAVSLGAGTSELGIPAVGRNTLLPVGFGAFYSG